MKAKTSELIGPALDWAVAKCAGLKGVVEDGPVIREYYPSTDWSQGGPIIEREKINLKFYDEEWIADPHDIDSICQRKHGPTPLIAAMRCYTARHLGEEVQVPDELA